jgi:hypothetical protein
MAGDPVSELLSDLQALYEKSGNPLYVWRAIYFWRASGGDWLPPWCLDYLEMSADELMKLSSDRSLSFAEKGSRVGAAMGLIGKGKNEFRREAGDAFNAKLATHLAEAGLEPDARLVALGIAEAPVKMEATIQEIREATGLSRSAVFQKAGSVPDLKYLVRTRRKKRARKQSPER